MYIYTDPLAIVVPVPAGPPLSSASSPWRCSVPAPCFVPTEPALRPCPPRNPLSAPHVVSYTPAYKTTRNTDICIYFRVWLMLLSTVCDQLNLQQNQQHSGLWVVKPKAKKAKVAVLALKSNNEWKKQKRGVDDMIRSYSNYIVIKRPVDLLNTSLHTVTS